MFWITGIERNLENQVDQTVLPAGRPENG